MVVGQMKGFIRIQVSFNVCCESTCDLTLLKLLIRFIYLLITGSIMAYSWDNRVKFIVRYMYDIDNNGFLDKNDFECLAVRNTVIETKVSVPY